MTPQTPREDWETEEPWISIEGILWDLSNQASGMHYDTALQEIKKHLDAHIHHVESSAREREMTDEEIERMPYFKARIEIAKDEVIKFCLDILADEINIAHTSISGKTSRLTSAYNRISALHPTHNEDKIGVYQEKIMPHEETTSWEGELEKEFEEWRDTKGGWPSRTECFEEWFLPKLHSVESSAREQGRKEEKERLLKTLYNLDRDPQELANQNAVRESELETPHRALDLEIIKEVLDNPFPVYPHPTHNEDKIGVYQEKITPEKIVPKVSIFGHIEEGGGISLYRNEDKK